MAVATASASAADPTPRRRRRRDAAARRRAPETRRGVGVADRLSRAAGERAERDGKVGRRGATHACSLPGSGTCTDARGSLLAVFDGKFRTPIDKAVKPIGDGLRRTRLTPDHLTIVGLLVGVGAAFAIGARVPAARPAPGRARGAARSARRRAGQGVGRGQPARRVLRLHRRPDHRRRAARRRGLVPRRPRVARTWRCCRSP